MCCRINQFLDDNDIGKMSFDKNIVLEKDTHPVVLLFLSNSNIDFDLRYIYEKTVRDAGHRFILCEVIIDNWDKYLTPWKVEDVLTPNDFDSKSGILCGRNFEGMADTLIDSFQTDIIPTVKKIYPSHGKIYICGYSLAGLFAIYALYNIPDIDGVVSCSGSLWYPGWNKYIDEHQPDHSFLAYLSLGKKETNAKNIFMKTVGEMTLKQLEQFEKSDKALETVFEWNDGGHFTDVDNRIIRGMSWILGKA